MKRILFVHHGKGIGGAPLTLQAIIRSLDRSRFSPCVLCLYETEATELFRRDGIETHVGRGIYHLAHTTGVWYPLRYLPIFLFRLSLFPLSVWNANRFLKNHRCDVVHLNSSSLLAIAIAARVRKIPVLTHVLEHIHPGYFGFRRSILTKLLIAFSDAIVCICHADARVFPKSSKLHVVYDGIDPEEFDPEKTGETSRSSLAIPAGAYVVGMLGGIQSIKGTFEFTKASVRVLQYSPNTHFVVLGVSPGWRQYKGAARVGYILKSLSSGEAFYRRRVFALGRRQPMKGNIHFYETVLNVPPFLKMLDVLVFPSTVPHFARPLIEAGLMKKPVVASRIGGPEEIVVDGITGFLVPPGKPDELARQILTLLYSQSLRSQMGEAGRNRALDLFDKRKNIPEIIKLYDVIIKGDR